MRELKFRGRRKNDGEWIVGKNIMFVFEGDNTETTCVMVNANEPYETLDDGFIKYRPFIIDKGTVGQYIGLSDKNGIDIFEGDIVKQNITYEATNSTQSKTRTGYITYVLQECGFRLVLSNSDVGIGHRNTGSGYSIDFNFEIIGNIYENANLLTQQN